MTVLVTGGAGYIGRVIAEELDREGFEIVLADDLRYGNRLLVNKKAKHVCMDVSNADSLDKIFTHYNIDSVIHLAQDTVKPVKLTQARSQYRKNIISGISLIEAMHRHNVTDILFSSTAEVYGIPTALPISEEHPVNPVNAYGESNLVFEQILEMYQKVYGLEYVIFRYFNVAGASKSVGERHPSHFIDEVLNAIFENRYSIPIYGVDFPTKDGSFLRDYVHVIDIAKAHILALKNIRHLNRKIYNLGTETGSTVLDVINTATEVTGRHICIELRKRRPEDIPRLVLDSSRAEKELGWKPKNSSLANIINTDWEWLQNYKSVVPATFHQNSFQKVSVVSSRPQTSTLKGLSN